MKWIETASSLQVSSELVSAAHGSARWGDRRTAVAGRTGGWSSPGLFPKDDDEPHTRITRFSPAGTLLCNQKPGSLVKIMLEQTRCGVGFQSCDGPTQD